MMLVQHRYRPGRRATLAYLGAFACTLAPPALAAAAATLCVARPEQTQGPFYVDERLERDDLRADPASGDVSAGVPLTLTFALARLASAQCTPLAGAKVDVWHCDAAGRYSDVRDGEGSTVGRKFLRGYR